MGGGGDRHANLGDRHTKGEGGMDTLNGGRRVDKYTKGGVARVVRGGGIKKKEVWYNNGEDRK